MKFPQAAFDVQQNSGGGQLFVRRQVMNNPPDSPYFPTADDYGCLGWTLDPEDVLTAAQTLTTGTIFGSLMVIPNTGNINRLSAAFATVQGTQTNANGVALYQPNAALTSLSLVASSANQTWTGVSTTAMTDNPFSTTPQITPGYYWACIMGSTSGAAATIHGANAVTAAVLNFSKNSGVSQWRSFTLAGQTAWPATITLSATTKSAFTPFLALS